MDRLLQWVGVRVRVMLACGNSDVCVCARASYIPRFDDIYQKEMHALGAKSLDFSPNMYYCCCFARKWLKYEILVLLYDASTPRTRQFHPKEVSVAVLYTKAN